MTESLVVTEPFDSPDDLLHVCRRKRGDAIVIHVAGEMDMMTVRLLDEHLTEVARTVLPSTQVELDLGEVTFMGSAGLSCLLRHDERRRLAGGALRVVATSRAVRRAIELTGLHTVLTVVNGVTTTS
jgi:anti-sigma B factor antagonist